MGQEMNWVNAIVNGGSAVAVIVVVRLFLEFLKAERADRKGERESFLAQLSTLSTSVSNALARMEELAPTICPMQSDAKRRLRKPSEN